MIGSVRRIATALLLASIFSLSSTAIVGISIKCGSGDSCVANLIGVTTSTDYIRNYPVDLATNGSTKKLLPTPTSFSDINTAIQQVSIYLLLFTLVVLMTLEIFELRYLKMLYKGMNVQ